MYVNEWGVNGIDPIGQVARAFSNFVIFRQRVYEKLEKTLDRSPAARTGTLLIRPWAAQYKISALLCRVIVSRMEPHMLPRSMAD